MLPELILKEERDATFALPFALGVASAGIGFLAANFLFPCSKTLFDRCIQGIVHQGRLAGPRNTGYADQFSKWEFHVNIFQVIF